MVILALKLIRSVMTALANFLVEKFSPVVVVSASDETKSLFETELGMTVADLIQPFFQKNSNFPKKSSQVVFTQEFDGLTQHFGATPVTIRKEQSSTTIDSFCLKMIDLEEFISVPNYQQELHILQSLVDHPNLAQPLDSNQTGAKKWVENYSNGLFGSTYYNEADVSISPSALIIATTTLDPNPLDTLRQLSHHTSLPPILTRGIADSTIDRFYVIFHPSFHPGAPPNVDNILSKLRQTFSTTSSILTIGEKTKEDLEQSPHIRQLQVQRIRNFYLHSLGALGPRNRTQRLSRPFAGPIVLPPSSSSDSTGSSAGLSPDPVLDKETAAMEKCSHHAQVFASKLTLRDIQLMATFCDSLTSTLALSLNARMRLIEPVVTNRRSIGSALRAFFGRSSAAAVPGGGRPSFHAKPTDLAMGFGLSDMASLNVLVSSSSSDKNQLSPNFAESLEGKTRLLAWLQFILKDWDACAKSLTLAISDARSANATFATAALLELKMVNFALAAVSCLHQSAVPPSPGITPQQHQSNINMLYRTISDHSRTAQQAGADAVHSFLQAGDKRRALRCLIVLSRVVGSMDPVPLVPEVVERVSSWLPPLCNPFSTDSLVHPQVGAQVINQQPSSNSSTQAPPVSVWLLSAEVTVAVRLSIICELLIRALSSFSSVSQEFNVPVPNFERKEFQRLFIIASTLNKAATSLAKAQSATPSQLISLTRVQNLLKAVSLRSFNQLAQPLIISSRSVMAKAFPSTSIAAQFGTSHVARVGSLSGASKEYLLFSIARTAFHLDSYGVSAVAFSLLVDEGSSSFSETKARSAALLQALDRSAPSKGVNDRPSFPAAKFSSSSVNSSGGGNSSSALVWSRPVISNMYFKGVNPSSYSLQMLKEFEFVLRHLLRKHISTWKEFVNMVNKFQLDNSNSNNPTLLHIQSLLHSPSSFLSFFQSLIDHHVASLPSLNSNLTSKCFRFRVLSFPAPKILLEDPSCLPNPHAVTVSLPADKPLPSLHETPPPSEIDPRPFLPSQYVASLWLSPSSLSRDDLMDLQIVDSQRLGLPVLGNVVTLGSEPLLVAAAMNDSVHQKYLGINGMESSPGDDMIAAVKPFGDFLPSRADIVSRAVNVHSAGRRTTSVDGTVRVDIRVGNPFNVNLDVANVRLFAILVPTDSTSVSPSVESFDIERHWKFDIEKYCMQEFANSSLPITPLNDDNLDLFGEGAAWEIDSVVNQAMLNLSRNDVKAFVRTCKVITSVLLGTHPRLEFAGSLASILAQMDNQLLAPLCEAMVDNLVELPNEMLVFTLLRLRQSCIQRVSVSSCVPPPVSDASHPSPPLSTVTTPEIENSFLTLLESHLNTRLATLDPPRGLQLPPVGQLSLQMLPSLQLAPKETRMISLSLRPHQAGRLHIIGLEFDALGGCLAVRTPLDLHGPRVVNCRRRNVKTTVPKGSFKEKLGGGLAFPAPVHNPLAARVFSSSTSSRKSDMRLQLFVSAKQPKAKFSIMQRPLGDETGKRTETLFPSPAHLYAGEVTGISLAIKNTHSHLHINKVTVMVNDSCLALPFGPVPAAASHQIAQRFISCTPSSNPYGRAEKTAAKKKEFGGDFMKKSEELARENDKALLAAIGVSWRQNIDTCQCMIIDDLNVAPGGDIVIPALILVPMSVTKKTISVLLLVETFDFATKTSSHLWLCQTVTFTTSLSVSISAAEVIPSCKTDSKSEALFKLSFRNDGETSVAVSIPSIINNQHPPCTDSANLSLMMTKVSSLSNRPISLEAIPMLSSGTFTTSTASSKAVSVPNRSGVVEVEKHNCVTSLLRVFVKKDTSNILINSISEKLVAITKRDSDNTEDEEISMDSVNLEERNNHHQRQPGLDENEAQLENQVIPSREDQNEIGNISSKLTNIDISCVKNTNLCDDELEEPLQIEASLIDKLEQKENVFEVYEQVEKVNNAIKNDDTSIRKDNTFIIAPPRLNEWVSKWLTETLAYRGVDKALKKLSSAGSTTDSELIAATSSAEASEIIALLPWWMSDGKQGLSFVAVPLSAGYLTS